jgi:S-sulfo-L-cysteine synthase (O-acetyl-L-serine-dependent)
MTPVTLAPPVVPSSAPVLPGSSRWVDLIGETPLVDLSFLAPEGVGIYAKAELRNPGGSVKDRPAKAMVLRAVEEGRLTPGDRDGPVRLLDATSGNTGIAYALLGAALGIPVTLCLPENASPERRKILQAYGVDLRLTDPGEGSDGAIREARRLAAAEPGRFAYLDQYGNDENWRAHHRTTGPEIWRQTGGAVSHFVTGLGTSGTFMGVGRYLRERAPGVRLISVEPDGPFHGLEGMKHMETAIVPPIYDPGLADEAWTLPTEEAYEMVLRLAREAGLLVGISAGANVASAVRLARRLDRPPADGADRDGARPVIVTILCDGADKYLSERFWEDAP